VCNGLVTSGSAVAEIPRDALCRFMEIRRLITSLQEAIMILNLFIYSFIHSFIQCLSFLNTDTYTDVVV